MKAIRTLQVEKVDWRKEIDSYLLAYRSTPHTVTGKSPAELMFQRKLRTKLPYLMDIETDLTGGRNRDNLEKEKGNSTQIRNVLLYRQIFILRIKCF